MSTELPNFVAVLFFQCATQRKANDFGHLEIQNKILKLKYDFLPQK